MREFGADKFLSRATFIFKSLDLNLISKGKFDFVSYTFLAEVDDVFINIVAMKSKEFIFERFNALCFILATFTLFLLELSERETGIAVQLLFKDQTWDIVLQSQNIIFWSWSLVDS